MAIKGELVSEGTAILADQKGFDIACDDRVVVHGRQFHVWRPGLWLLEIWLRDYRQQHVTTTFLHPDKWIWVIQYLDQRDPDSEVGQCMIKSSFQLEIEAERFFKSERSAKENGCRFVLNSLPDGKTA